MPDGVLWPEMDTSSLGQTMTVVAFHRKYMKNVFTSDELDQYTHFKKEARRIRKQHKASQFLNTTMNSKREKR